MPNFTNALPFLRPVSDLLADEAFDVRHQPSCMAVYAALDRLLAASRRCADGTAEVPMSTFASQAGEIVGIFFAMSMLPPGLVVICGRAPDGQVFEGEALLDEAARREAACQAALQVFYRVQTSHLALDSSLAAVGAGA
jgi:hypothetical protein